MRTLTREQEHIIQVGAYVKEFKLSSAQSEVLIMALGYGFKWFVDRDMLVLSVDDPDFTREELVKGFMKRTLKFIPEERQVYKRIGTGISMAFIS